MGKKFTALCASALSAVMLLSGCGGDKRMSAETDGDKSLNDKVVATIGKTEITQADYNFIYKLVHDNMSQYSSYYGDDWENMEIEDGKTMGDYMKENTEAQIKQMAAAVALAEDNGIKADSTAVRDAVTKNKNNLVEQNYKGTDGYKAYLEEARTTDKAFDRYLEIVEIYDRLYKELTKTDGKASIDNDKLKKDFLKEYADKWRVQHILIGTKAQTDSSGNETKPAKTDEEAKKIAEEVIAKLDAGADFDDLIEEYNEDPGISKGKFYVFGTGEMVPEFEEASKNLEIGSYTKEPVKTDYGYHIIKRYVIDDTIDEFKDYKKQKLQEKVMDLIDKKLKKMKPVKFESKTIDKYLDEWSKSRKKEAEAAQKNADAQQSTAPAEDSAQQTQDTAQDAAQTDEKQNQ